jgi:hypothetical protein
MRIKPNLVSLFVAFLLSISIPFTSRAQDFKSQIDAEIERLQESLKSHPIAHADLAPVVTGVNEALSGSTEALNSGKLFLSLEKLLQAEDLLQGARVTLEKADAVKSGYPAFEVEWKNVSENLTTVNRTSREKNWTGSPAAIRALAETALGRSVPLLDGGRGFALATKPADGLFYLGQAQGEAGFAKFAAALHAVSPAQPFPLRSYLPELQKLQEKTNAAFQPPRSVQLHDRFIALNSALKLAQELDAQKFYAGALYQYLEALRHYGMLDAPPVDAARQRNVKLAITDEEQKLARSKRDDSIAQLFLQRISTQLAHADGSPASPDEFRSAQVILGQVLPAYFAAAKPAAALRQANTKAVQLTLVRWPYT